MIIGMWGLNFESRNLGCAALAYSFFEIIKSIAEKEKLQVSIYLFTQEKAGRQPVCSSAINKFNIIEYHFKDIKSVYTMKKKIDECDVIFDFTEGDSFSDIYGLSRFLKTSFLKSVIIKSKPTFVLGPQTYGPYKTQIANKWAKWIIHNADYVFTRDELSLQFAEQLSRRDVILTTDVAFALPYEELPKFSSVDNQVHIGINVSGLLWNGGYTKNNQFELTLDYRKYLESLVSWLVEKKYIVHLIGHVTSETLLVEDDLVAAEELNKRLGNKCNVVPAFSTPIEAKSYISRLDCFIGSRMHSTIASISSGCPVIPVAYSRKFNGLFLTLEYPFLVDARVTSTEDAVAITTDYIRNLRCLDEKTISSRNIATRRIEQFKRQLVTILKE